MKTKRYRWNYKKFLHNLAVLAVMGSLGIGAAWLLYLWAMA